MKKSFEEIALEIVKTYISAKQASISNGNGSFNINHLSELNCIDAMTRKVIKVADSLAENHRQRAINWDKENFDREVEKMLTEDPND